ncbi:LLM class flavin-dependent oxidoreductase [Streptomyces actinomycinicus]|uniref:LLM class flavin-dependent oxidoreductase n=1 Tax=Streptomyces actinomycinicus TaxID=1695166 RepID=A0A937EQL8_9ACTN|nr:LLM class flavin-dependent oxidoreductase [Streptomyces actinomycinicus]MBL1086219.1 LLM class flavin-dependent oxidoreductase [Streptomyces actinomycinicus]
MSARYGGGLVHLAAALDHPLVPDTVSCIELARLAERGGLDFVTLDDSFAPWPAPGALGPLSRVASATRRIGLVPRVAADGTDNGDGNGDDNGDGTDNGDGNGFGAGTGTGFGVGTGTEPLRTWAGAAGRGGAGAAGRAGAGVAGLDPAGVAGPDPGRVGWRFEGGLPRPPQGDQVRVVDATDARARTVAARYADVALVRAATPASAAETRHLLREEARSSGRAPGELRVLVSLLVDLGDGEYAAEPGREFPVAGRGREPGEGGGGPGGRPAVEGPLYRGGPVALAELIAAWHADGVTDGFHLVPVEPRRDLERLVNGTVALLQHRGLFRTFYPGSTLREHLGLGSRSAAGDRGSRRRSAPVRP